MWFDSWDSMFKILISGIIGYVMVVFYVRILGKRATAKMNNFDWIVTVAVGSLLASMVLMKDVAVAEGALAIGLLLGLQFVFTLVSSRSERIRHVLMAPPRVLFFDGKYLEEAMLRERVSPEEVNSAIRESGSGSTQNVYAVVMEPDAQLAIVKRDECGDLKILKSITGASPMEA